MIYIGLFIIGLVLGAAFGITIMTLMARWEMEQRERR